MVHFTMDNDQNLEKNSIVLYTSDEGAATVEVLLKDETMWLTQKTMAQLDELLERIREIRASERRFYQKITDIYAQCSYD
ncbi:MAG: hypothetical protein A4E27_01484 [Methanobacterium sp. PtaU1.Bin242]|nr:MAG: hypothetical protein A4E27_01484 [Methanobacterium sp. PtaU1.Bin242]